jgi:hypothetical protein
VRRADRSAGVASHGWLSPGNVRLRGCRARAARPSTSLTLALSLTLAARSGRGAPGGASACSQAAHLHHRPLLRLLISLPATPHARAGCDLQEGAAAVRPWRIEPGHRTSHHHP